MLLWDKNCNNLGRTEKDTDCQSRGKTATREECHKDVTFGMPILKVIMNIKEKSQSIFFSIKEAKYVSN